MSCYINIYLFYPLLCWENEFITKQLAAIWEKMLCFVEDYMQNPCFLIESSVFNLDFY